MSRTEQRSTRALSRAEIIRERGGSLRKRTGEHLTVHAEAAAASPQKKPKLNRMLKNLVHVELAVMWWAEKYDTGRPYVRCPQR